MFLRSSKLGLRNILYARAGVYNSLSQKQFYSAIARRSRFGRKLVDKKEEKQPTTTTTEVPDVPEKKQPVISKLLKETDPVKTKFREKKPGISKRSAEKPSEARKEDVKKVGSVKDNKQLSENEKGKVKKSYKKSEKSYKAKNTKNSENQLDGFNGEQVKIKVKKGKRQRLSSGPKTKLDIPTFLSVANFATILRVRVPELLLQLKELGFENMTNDYILDAETASLIAEEYGFEVNHDDNLGADLFPSPDTTDPKKVKPRAPIVTIMGHVDHGKTTILDYLRKSSIVKGEHGGITQHIGAFSVVTPKSNKKITFLDTPGHAAFLKMRERGANMTDVIILVVAAEDSVMPQTVEAIKHAKNAGVPVIVALNKCDKEEANPDKVVADLSANGVDVEDYGGDVPVVRISAKTGMGMEDLEENIVAISELQELKTEDKGVPVEGWVLESQVKQGLGNVATFLIKKGQLKSGSILVAGTTWCKVKLMRNELGKSIKTAGPSTPVEISGWRDIPEAGEFAIQSKDEAYAKKVISNREKRKRQIDEASQVDEMNKNRIKQLEDAQRDVMIQDYQRQGLTIEEIKELEPELFGSLENRVKEVFFIIKADVSGSTEAVKQSIEGLGNEEVKVHILYEEVGAPTESDVERAKNSGAEILAFNIKIPKEIRNSASVAGVEIKEFNVIYHLIESVLESLSNNLPTILEFKVIAKVSVRQLFEISLKNKEKMVIAGSRVTEGILKRNADVRILRDGEETYRGKIKQLKIAKDDAIEVKNGVDCGIALEGDPELLEGDVIESFEEVPIKRHL